MDFYAVLDQVVDLLRRRGRVTYGALKLQFGLNDEQVAVLKEELIDAQQLARDEHDRILVWTGAMDVPSASLPPVQPASQAVTPEASVPETPSGLAQPLEVYQELSERPARSRLEAASGTGMTPLVGREQEVGLLLERWAQVKDGLGQVVLLRGEAGIGKSRLIEALQEHLAAEPRAWLTPCQCSPYYQHSALYPLIDLLERVVLRCGREESPQQKLHKLEGLVAQYGMPPAETICLFADLLSLPLPANYAPLSMSPEQQKQQTLNALLLMLQRLAAQQPVLLVMEDLHWVDPSTLEFLSLLVDQGPTARILTLLTCRPDFNPPWTGGAHLTQVTVGRLPQQQAVEMIRQVAHGKVLPPEVVEQIVARTDGMPLFVEELTKTVLESGLLQARAERYQLTGPLPRLARPATLHDALLARLDRLGSVKAIAQLGATLGREFSYALLQAVSPWNAATLQRGVQQLVAAEFLYQRGLPPQATYVFKHALMQEAAYQSLPRSTRQQYHRRLTQVLEARFAELCETQPELLAQHSSEAGLHEQAIGYWQKAGQRAIERSAPLEAIAHLRKGLEGLGTLPDTPERTRQELGLLMALGQAYLVAHGHGVVEVADIHAHARALCKQVGETPGLFPTLWELWRFYFMRAEHQTARELAEQCLSLAQRVHVPGLLLVAHHALGGSLLWLGEVTTARAHLEQALTLYEPQRHHQLAMRYGLDLGVWCLAYDAWSLWLLGYPEQALRQSRVALALARQLAHPHSLAAALNHMAILHCCRREGLAGQECAEASLALAHEHGLSTYVTLGRLWRGWALAAQGQGEEGIAQLHQALDVWRATGAELDQPRCLAGLAEAYGQVGQTEAGLSTLAEALAAAHSTGERYWEAELHRLQGELLLRQSASHAAQAEACLQQARAIARQQQARSLELRAVMSLARLWRQQGKWATAYEGLALVYGWFTEGFDTADLQEARALLEDLQKHL